MASCTSLSRLAPWQARGVLALFCLLTVAAVAVTLSGYKSGFADAPDRGPGDIALYAAEVDRIAGGQGYYEAAGAELVARGYPTSSVFNWRLPLPMWLLGQLPSPAWGKAILGGLAISLVLLAFAVAGGEGGLRRAAACALLVFGAVMPCLLGRLYVMPVLWAGVLIGLSISCYALKADAWAVAFGLAAVFFRELALPYCLLMAGLAVWEGRRRELLAWFVGLAAFALFLAVHAGVVMQLVGRGDVVRTASWFRFGGAAFVISITQMNAFLLLSPQWLTAVYLTCALLGLAGWNSETGRRVGLTVSLYVAGMACVGQEVNQYWGSLIAVLLCFGVVRAPATLADLWQAARGHKLTRLRATTAAGC